MLELNNVSAGYGAQKILNQITLKIERQEILALIGLNGSGKSTLLRTMLGLLPVTQGSIHLDGKLSSALPPWERAKLISLLDSKIQLSFPISISELLKLGSRRHQTPSQELQDEALHALGLQGFENRNILELSSGEAKRALIAHTLCSGAKIILLDEPLTNLDWSHQADLVENLKKWQIKHATTFVVAIHELDWAVKLAHRIAVVHKGRLLFVGAPEETLLRADVREVFAFNSRIDENPFDGSKQLILTRVKKESESPFEFKK